MNIIATEYWSNNQTDPVRLAKAKVFNYCSLFTNNGFVGLTLFLQKANKIALFWKERT